MPRRNCARPACGRGKLGTAYDTRRSWAGHGEGVPVRVLANTNACPKSGDYGYH